MNEKKKLFINGKTCPWWFIHSFDNPFRELIHDPEKILAPYVGGGDTVLDVGCGMGYFSMGLAKLVGNDGKVICADVQEKMLSGLVKRAKMNHLDSKINPHLSAIDCIGVKKK